MSKPSLNTEIPEIGCKLRVCIHLHDGMAFDLKNYLASRTTVRASRSYLAYLFRLDGYDTIFLVQGTGGTVVNTFTTGYTVFIKLDFKAKRPTLFIKGLRPDHKGIIFTDPFTATAENTFVTINDDCMMTFINGIKRGCTHSGLVEVHTEFNIKTLEVTAIKSCTTTGQATFSLTACLFLGKSKPDLAEITGKDFR